MAFVAQKVQTKQGKHPLLVYQLPSNPDCCYKFKWKRSNTNSHSYTCLECQNASEHDASIIVYSLKVDLDFSRFLTDPEQLSHKCNLLKYLNVEVEQIYR